MKQVNTSFILSILFISACNSTGSIAKPKATLLFSSGFEGDIAIEKSPYDDYKFITGKDSETNYQWPLEVLGSSESGLHYIYDNDYQSMVSKIVTTTGHDNKSTQALYSEITCGDNLVNCVNGDTQNPYEILNIKDGKHDLYIKYWIKLDEESMKGSDTWRTFFEWKTKGYDEGTGFRLISYINTDDDGSLYWRWQGDDNSETDPIWKFDNKEIEVPITDWFKTEFYWSWSNDGNSRALWKINDQVIKDYKGPHVLPNDPVDFIMLTQIYSDNNPKHQWIDDIEIWDGLPDEKNQNLLSH